MRRILAVPLALAAGWLPGCGGDSEPAAAPSPFFGVAPQEATSDVDLQRMAVGNVGSYHLLLSWSRIESEPDSYDWSSYDALIGKLAALEIEPVPYVFGTPAHLAEQGSDPPTSSPEALRAWERFLRAAAERYGPGGELWVQLARTDPDIAPQPLRIWEIWNEVNSPTFWSPEPSPEDYATLLKRSRRALRKADPEARTMVAGMFATPGSELAIESFDFLRRMYEQRNAAEAADLVGIHPYGPRLADVREQIERTREEMDRGGNGEAGLWVTEIGWGSDPGVPSQLAKTPERQAALLRRTYELLIEERERWNVQGALWYTWRDAAAPVALCGWCASAGLLDDDLDPKPAWVEYTRLTGGQPAP